MLPATLTLTRARHARDRLPLPPLGSYRSRTTLTQRGLALALIAAALLTWPSEDTTPPSGTPLHHVTAQQMPDLVDRHRSVSRAEQRAPAPSPSTSPNWNTAPAALPPLAGPVASLGDLPEVVAAPDTYRAYARTKVDDPDQFACLDQVWTAESGWRPDAQNPTSTAYGIAQFLDSTWAGTGVAKTSDGQTQIDAGLIYITSRYGTACQALHFRQDHGWY